MRKDITAVKAFQEDIKVILPFFELNTKHEKLQNFINIFTEILSLEAEFSFAPYKKYLEITIHGKGSFFHKKIELLMKDFQISEDAITIYRKINEFFPDTGTLLKSDFHKKEDSSISIYYQTQLPLKLASEISFILNGIKLPVDILLDITKILGRKGVYLGMDFSRNTSPALSIFCPLPPKKAKVLESFLQVMKMLKKSETQIMVLEKYHKYLTEFISGDLFVSFPIQESNLDSIKIDYELINIPLVVKILKEVGIFNEELQRFLKIAKALDISLLSYLGIKYLKNGEITLKFYFKRVYYHSENEEMEKIANFLKSTIWRFG